VGYLARTSTALLDAYLTPVLRKYLSILENNFSDDQLPIYFMQSDGGIVPASEFTGYKSILSGPAGGITGYAKTTVSENFGKAGVIGFDMGGTSTDVSVFDGEFDLNYEAEIAGTFISTPHLDINTVAAGGGSRLFFRNSMFEVGPESAGSHPGPVCYGKNGYLAVTDANLQMGRIQSDYFPPIFGAE
jgi:5-oxoprolinase (ATP-hydrolysing)